MSDLCAKVANPRVVGAGFEPRQGQEKIPFSETSRRGLGCIQSPAQWVTEFFAGGKVDRSLSSSAEVKNEWKYISAPPIRLHGMDREKICL